MKSPLTRSTCFSTRRVASFRVGWESRVGAAAYAGLTSLLTDEAPSCIKQFDIKTLFGRKVAIDASMSLYQFLIAVRQADGQQMMSESGEVTSHLLGFFYRTLRMVDYGIKPAYVFDGKPPDLKKEVVRTPTHPARQAFRQARRGARAGGGEQGYRYVLLLM